MPELTDYINALPHADHWYTPRIEQVRGITLHYNGPAVKDRSRAGELRQLAGDAKYHRRAGVISRFGADGLQYHAVGLADGTILQTRPFDRQAWHCHNELGNTTHLAYHMPLGGQQDCTDVQWQAFQWFVESRGFTPANVEPHCNWFATACPGPFLLARLVNWQRGITQARGRFRVTHWAANVREGPGTGFPVALHGTAVLPPGHVFDADAIVSGTVHDGDPRWVHRADDLGFVHMSLLEVAE